MRATIGAAVAIGVLVGCKGTGADSHDSASTRDTSSPHTGVVDTSAPVDSSVDDSAGRDSSGGHDTAGGGDTGATGPVFPGEATYDDADLLFHGGLTGAEAGPHLAWVDDSDGDGVAELAVTADGVDHAYVASVEGSSNLFLAAGDYSAVERGSGRTLASGDFDCDGASDLALGSPSSDYDGHAYAYGAVYVQPGPLTGQVDLDTDAWAKLIGGSYEDWLGHVVRHIGDHDGDGCDDLAMSGQGNSDLYAVSGGTLSGGPVWLPDGHIHLEGRSGRTTQDLAGGDFDGDGFSDTVVVHDALVSILRGPLPTTGRLADATDHDLEGLRLGRADVGDLDRDGYDDLVVGGHRDRRALVFLAPSTSGSLTALADLQVLSKDSDEYGTSVLALGPGLLGDVPGVVVSTGVMLYAWTGDTTGVVSTSTADLTVSATDERPVAVGLVQGDLEGDGAAELLFGVPDYRDETGAVLSASLETWWP